MSAIPPPVTWIPPIPLDSVGDLVGVAAVEDERTVVGHVAEDAASRAPDSDLSAPPIIVVPTA